MHIRATVSDMFQDGMNVPYTMEVWDSGCGDNNYLSGNGGGYNWATFQTDTYGTFFITPSLLASKTSLNVLSAYLRPKSFVNQ